VEQKREPMNRMNRPYGSGRAGSCPADVRCGLPGGRLANQFSQSRIVKTSQLQDNWIYVRGKHALKAGVNWTYQRSPNVFLPAINGRRFVGGLFCSSCESLWEKFWVRFRVRPARQG
jgi:hypothetical protein